MRSHGGIDAPYISSPWKTTRTTAAIPTTRRPISIMKNDFGIGEGRDGILLLQSTWGRDYGLYIRDGYANSMVGKYARTLLEDAFLDDFADDDYRGGYEDYLSTCADFFERAAQGHPVRKPLIKVLPLALGIGLGLALLVCLMLKAK